MGRNQANSPLDSILDRTQHRPWPLPSRPWVMVQTWNDLMFAHWPVDPASIRSAVPAQLELDTFDGRCWIAVAPFWMSGVRGRWLPAVPGMSRFPELNVRTYVRFGGRPGVYFFSLDTTSIAAVMGARTFYALPYFYARMHVEVIDRDVFYHSHRIDVDRVRPVFHGNADPDPQLLRTDGLFRAHYRPDSPVFISVPGSLEHFLTERYCLYSVSGKRVYRGDIHHLPWPLQTARADIEHNTVALADGIRLPSHPPLLHFAKQLTVLVWWPERIH